VRKIKSAEPKVEETSVVAEEVPKIDIPSLIDKVMVKVLIGTLSWAGGTFQKGDIFACTKQDLARFDPRDIQVLS